MKKLMIATPAYSGTVHVQYALSLANTMQFLPTMNIGVQPHISTSGSLLVAERNRIIQNFWESDCTHLLCIDSDLGWPKEAVVAMLNADKEFIAGIYPARGLENEFIFRPASGENGEMIQDENMKHLFKAEYIPAGFMLLSKSAIEKMRKLHSDLYFKPKNERFEKDEGYCFFNTEVWDGEFWGEDYVFCRKAREAGIEIWIDPLIQFDHAGKIGMLAETFMKKDEVQ